MPFKKAPIRKSIEDTLLNEEYHAGVWKARSRKYYVKVCSELNPPVIEIPAKDYKRRKHAVRDAIRCAKVYNKLRDAGMYHPKTEFIVYESRKNILSLLVIMPRLDTLNAKGSTGDKIRLVERRLGFYGYYWGDIMWPFNWGADKRGILYAHDLHIADNYGQVLELADRLGIK